ncbi:MAG: tRNA lysidine(34) synthetase TilS [Thermoguttaceae bacterium]
MTSASAFEAQLVHRWPPPAWADVTVVVAVSGGADSVALLRGLAAVRGPGLGRLLVAHFNHGFRGVESDGDERFVGRLAEKLGLGWVCGRMEAASAGAGAGAESREETARARRYEFLTRAAEESGARYVACAHTADDQAETILHRVVRGTGIAGLAGMPRCRRLSGAVTLIRPLLEIRRAEVVEYLAGLGQPYRDDRSNADRRFTRNRIRHELLPQLAENYNRAVRDALLRLGRLAGEVQEVVDGLVSELLREGAVEQVNDRVLVRRQQLAAEADYLVRETLLATWQAQGWPLQSMGLEEWDLLVEMLRGDRQEKALPGKRMFPGLIEAERCPEGLRLRCKAGPAGGAEA